MSRPLRIQYPDPWYHDMNRGRRAGVIFSDAQDYTAVRKWDWLRYYKKWVLIEEESEVSKIISQKKMAAVFRS